MIKTIKNDSKSEITEKKSKFIANLFYIESKKEAEDKILEIKRENYNAKHNCFAFNVIEDNKEFSKCSDDGEPSGTAGVAILSVIKKYKLENVLIVVTRYFGGILLGTGGLLRAYSSVSTKVIDETEIILKEYGLEEKIEISYNDSKNFNYYCNKNNIKINNVEYKENIFYFVELNEEKYANLKLAKNEKDGFNIISYVTMCRKYIEKEK